MLLQCLAVTDPVLNLHVITALDVLVTDAIVALLVCVKSAFVRNLVDHLYRHRGLLQQCQPISDVGLWQGMCL